MKIYILIFIIFTISYSLSQIILLPQNSQQDKPDLWDIFALDNNTAYACGGGVFYKTTDGGITWKIKQNVVELGRVLCSIYFFDNNTGWMVTRSGGIVLRTKDGGESWDENIVYDEREKLLYDVFFVDSIHGWICGAAIYSDSQKDWPEARLYQSINGGNTWTLQNYFNRSETYFHSIFFYNKSIGWLAGYKLWGVILKSEDGGDNWNENEFIGLRGIHKIFFLDDKYGWLVTVTIFNVQFARTIDGGSSWHIQNEVFQGPIGDIFFITPSHGFAISTGYYRGGDRIGNIFFTSDSGKSWDIKESYDEELAAIHFVNEKTGWIVGESSLILKTIDGGENWIKQSNFIVGINESYEDNNFPLQFSLSQNFPNPFNPSTTIEFTLPKSEFVTLKVYNMLGQEVAELVSERLDMGIHKYEWNASEYVSGLYFYKLSAGGYTKVRKLLLIR